uniref:Uncharacterized protein n=1 Tax=Meloidogyne enterolobii TaxID=390850 RepID=A0A6V7UTQ0_MELEN|nr:unnamed protein product [Meloidogyne enterolobii]
MSSASSDAVISHNKRQYKKRYSISPERRTQSPQDQFSRRSSRAVGGNYRRSKPYFNPRHHTLEEKEERNGEKDERRGRKTERKEERGEKNEEKEMKLSRKDERKEERREKKERKEDVEMKEEKEMVWHRAKSFRTVAEFDAWAYRVHFYQTWAHRPPNIQTMYGVNHFYVCGMQKEH